MTEHDDERRATLDDLMAPDPDLPAVRFRFDEKLPLPPEPLELPEIKPGEVVKVGDTEFVYQPLPAMDVSDDRFARINTDNVDLITAQRLQTGVAAPEQADFGDLLETTPMFDELAGDESDQAKRMHDDLHAEGYKGVRGYEGLKKGLRVRMVGHQFAEAYAHGSGEILGVFRKHESDWESTYNRPDVELLIRLDQPSIADQVVVRAASYGVVIHEDLAPDALADQENPNG